MFKAGWGRSVILYRLAQNSALLPVPELVLLLPVPEQALLLALLPELLSVPRPLLGPLSVSESACSPERQGRLYIPSR